jgi:hypothetical protein
VKSRMKEGLLGVEARDPALEERYRARLRALTERRLGSAGRIVHAVGLAIGLALSIRFVQLMVSLHDGGRAEQWIGLGIGLAFGVCWTLAEAAVLRAGVEQLFSHGAIRTALVVTFTFVLAGLMLWAGIQSANPTRGMHLILFGLVFWCAIGLPFLMAHLVKSSEVRVRASLIELELARAEAQEERS